MTKTSEQVFVTVEGKQVELADGQMITAKIDQDLDQPDMAIITVTNGNDWMTKKTFEIGFELKLETQQDKDKQRIFMGEIVGVEPLYEAANHVKLTIRAFDRAHRLQRGKKSRTFEQMMDSDIVKKIAQEYGLTADVESTNTVHKHIYQHNQSDLEFLRIRAARLNYVVGVDDKTLYFKNQTKVTRTGASSAPVKLKVGTEIHSFMPRLSAAKQVSKVTVRGWDPAKKEAVVGVASTADAGPKAQVPSDGSKASEKAFGKAEELEFTYDQIMTVKDAEAMAKAILEQQKLSFITGQMECDGNPALQPAAKVEVSGAEQFDGTFDIGGATHIFNRSGYTTIVRFANMKLPSAGSGGGGQGSAASAAGGTKFAVGIVTNNEDPEGHGRVKVKLPTHGDNIESDWARMVSPMAGSDRGLFILPEVNDEVLLAFEGGGSNAKPVVLGSVWNGTDKAPLEASKAVSGGKVVQRVLKSRAGHTVLMDDTDGDEKVCIEDSKGNKITFECKSNKLSIEFAGDIDIKSKANINIEATGNMSLKANGNMDVNASGMTNIKGSMVNLN